MALFNVKAPGEAARIRCVSLLECNFVRLTEANSVAQCQGTVCCVHKFIVLSETEAEGKRVENRRKQRTDSERLSGPVKRMSLADGRAHTLLQHACSGAYPLSQAW